MATVDSPLAVHGLKTKPSFINKEKTRSSKRRLDDDFPFIVLTEQDLSPATIARVKQMYERSPFDLKNGISGEDLLAKIRNSENH